jgi:hypothetical protein
LPEQSDGIDSGDQRADNCRQYYTLVKNASFQRNLRKPVEAAKLIFCLLLAELLASHVSVRELTLRFCFTSFSPDTFYWHWNATEQVGVALSLPASKPGKLLISLQEVENLTSQAQ